jgi:hypothetical protein
MKLFEINELTTITLMKDFVNLHLRDAPRFEVGRNIRVNDIDGREEVLPLAVISHDTMQKYIVPRGDHLLVPIPKGEDWWIYKVSPIILRQVIDSLVVGSSLDDFYNSIESSGIFWRTYY